MLFRSAQIIFKLFIVLHFCISLCFSYAAIFCDGKDWYGTLLFIPVLFTVIIAISLERNKYFEIFQKEKNILNEPEDYIIKALVFIEVVFNNLKEGPKCMILMKGYIARHVNECSYNNCVLKKYVNQYFNMNAILKLKNLTHEFRIQNTAKKAKIILSHCHEIFLDGITKFKNNNELRIFYSIYLIQIANNRSSALNELSIVEISNPTFEQQSLLHHCREIIKESILNEKNNDQMNITSAMAYDSHWNSFQEKIIDIGILHHQFWELLADDCPDLTQLRNIGFKIQNTINELNSHWERMQEIYPNEPNALRRYGLFAEIGRASCRERVYVRV